MENNTENSNMEIGNNELREKFRRIIQKFKNTKVFKNKYNIDVNKDCSNIPIMTRDEIIDFDIEECPEQPERVYRTSGSSGIKKFVYVSKDAHKAIMDRGNEILFANNIEKNIRGLILTEIGKLYTTEVLTEGITKYGITPLTYGNFNENDFLPLQQIVSNQKPKIIFCFTNQLFSFFSKITEHNVTKAIVFGEMLFDDYRKKMEDSAKIKIINVYASSETGPIASETPDTEKDSFLCLKDLHLEVFKDEKIKESGVGELLITDFNNKSCPIIRYKIGDNVEIKKISGKKYLKILGRSDNIINLNSQLVDTNAIKQSIQEKIKSDQFFITITKDTKSYIDIITVYTKEIGIQEVEEIKRKMASLGSPVLFKKFNKPVKTDTGKIVNIIDLRKKGLNEIYGKYL